MREMGSCSRSDAIQYRIRDPMFLRGLNSSGVGMTAAVDFTSQAIFRDPAAGIERLRALGPDVATRFPNVGKVRSEEHTTQLQTHSTNT